MASTKMLYQCDACKTTYDTLEEAIKCEASHPSIVGIVKTIYQFNYNTFPGVIRVEFDDKIKKYYKIIAQHNRRR